MFSVRIDMIGFRALFLVSALSLFFAGCAHTTFENSEQTAKPPKKHSYRNTAFQTTLRCPENDDRRLYGMAIGSSVEEAKMRAISNLRERVWSDFLAKADDNSYEKGRVLGYISKEDLKRVKRALEKIPDSKYMVFKKYTQNGGSIAAVVTIERKEMAKPLKKSLLSKLVAVEERWHRSRGQSILERYLLAVDSLGKMQLLLPEYLLADFISPFSTAIAARVENGLPYFDKTAGRLKKRLRFCIEPVSTPAMKLFADAVAKVLKKERLISTDPDKGDSRTLCITIEGDLVHKRYAQQHIFEATLQLTLHKRYKAPISIQRYKVRGVSNESGTKALEKAAEALQKEMERRFLQTV